MTTLRPLLRINAASCLGFGMLFLAAPGAVARTLGAAPEALPAVLGVGLLLNGAHLLLAARRPRPVEAEIVWFSLGDLAWWLGTMALVGAGVWITTPAGTAAALIVGAGVAALGVAQLSALGAGRASRSMAAQWRRIGRSWAAMPRPVWLWLVALNLVFLAAPVALPWPVAATVLVAYAASGPVVLAVAAAEGGFSRAAGLGHLLPWVPMLAWLSYWIATTEATPAARGYAVALGAMTAVCLALDLNDLRRWIRGERGVLTPPAAAPAAP